MCPGSHTSGSPLAATAWRSATAVRGVVNSVNDRIVSIYSILDPHIPGGCRLTGAENIELPTVGPFRILADRRARRIVIRVAGATKRNSAGGRSPVRENGSK